MGLATGQDKAVTLGQIAHIHAHSDVGPRSKPLLSAEERDCYENWILLCGDCHKLIDGQTATYTADFLKELKIAHERWVDQQLQSELASVSFAELEVIMKGILANPKDPNSDFTIIPPKDKIEKNSLSDRVADRIRYGMIKCREVDEYLTKLAQIDANFSERLRQGFVAQYKRLQGEGLDGDALFLELQTFASHGSSDFLIQAAGLAVLVYLFEKCEVFEH